MKRKCILIFFILLIASVTTARAEINEGSFSLTPFVGYYSFEGDEDFKDQPMVGLRFGYNVTKNIGFEGLLHFLKTEKNIPGDIAWYNRYGGSIEGIYHFLPDGRFVPFIATGVGVVHEGKKGEEPSSNKFVLDYGAGFKYFLTENVAFRADIRHVLPMNDTQNNLMCTVGINFAFGGKKAVEEAKIDEPSIPMVPKVKIAQPPPTKPPPVKYEKPPVPIYIPPPLQRVEKTSFILKVQFDKANKYAIDKKYHKNIKRLADFMKEHPETSIEIIGHTNNTGNEGYDIISSQKRADSVRKYLVDEFGIKAARVHALGYGSSQPVASNKTNEGRQKNQRIEVVIENLEIR